MAGLSSPATRPVVAAVWLARSPVGAHFAAEYTVPHPGDDGITNEPRHP